MASACVNNIGMPPENFLECAPVKCPSYGWMSPRISFSREFPDEDASKTCSIVASADNETESGNIDSEKQEHSDPEVSGKDIANFEFRPEDPVKMLPADELISGGKLVPLHLSTVRQSTVSVPESTNVKAEEAPKLLRRNEISSTDPYLFSPKAPTCTSHWKELLGLKKLYQNSNAKEEIHKTASALSSHDHNRKTARCVKHFLRRGSRSSVNASVDPSLSLPLLKESDNESSSVSTRLSFSSSGHEHDNLPRLSLDSDKPSAAPRTTRQITKNLSKVRVVKHRSVLSSENSTASARVSRSPARKPPESTVPVRDVSVDSPRMISSGKILFHSLERSSSSPSTFNDGPRYKHRGMERSYSAHAVRVTPVLNVPVCSLRGSTKSGTVFGFPLFSSQLKSATRSHQHQSKSRTDRTREDRFNF